MAICAALRTPAFALGVVAAVLGILAASLIIGGYLSSDYVTKKPVGTKKISAEEACNEENKSLPKKQVCPPSIIIIVATAVIGLSSMACILFMALMVALSNSKVVVAAMIVTSFVFLAGGALVFIYLILTFNYKPTDELTWKDLDWLFSINLLCVGMGMALFAAVISLASGLYYLFCVLRAEPEDPEKDRSEQEEKNETEEEFVSPIYIEPSEHDEEEEIPSKGMPSEVPSKRIPSEVPSKGIPSEVPSEVKQPAAASASQPVQPQPVADPDSGKKRKKSKKEKKEKKEKKKHKKRKKRKKSDGSDD